MAEEEVGLRTTLKDRRQTAAGLRDIEGGLDRVGRSAQTAGTRARMASRGFDSMRRSGRLAGHAIRLGFVTALGAGYAAIRLLRSSFDEAREAQKVGALTRSTIKSTGGAANVTARQVERLTTRLSQMAGIDDELVQSGGNVLLTFKNVRNEMGKNNKIFNQATKAAVDLSTTPLLNGNVTGASKMLGKALNDPLKGVTALTKAGVQFEEGQLEQIKNFVEQGKLLGAQKIILGEVNSQVGGAAKAQRTWGDVASVTFANIQERIGTGLMPLLDRFNKWFSTDGAKSVDHYLDVFEDKGIPALQHFTDEAIPLARRVLPKVAGVLGTIRDVVVAAAPYAERLIDAFNNMPDWAKKGIAGGAVAGYLGSKTGVFSGLGSLIRGGKGAGGLIASAKPVPVFVTNPGFAGAKGGVTPLVAGGKGPKGGRAPRLGGKFGPVGGLLAALGLGTAAAATSGGQSGSNQSAVSNTLTGASLGSFGGPVGTVLGGGFGATYDAYNSTPTKDLAISKYEQDLAGRENFAEQLSGGTEGPKLLDMLSASIEGVMTKVNETDVQAVTLGGTLSRVGKTEVAPPFTTPGLDQADRRAGDYKGLLDAVGRPVSTRVDANTSPATTKVDSLAQHIRNVLSSAATTVNVALSGLAGKAAGGPVTAGTPYVVGERRPELFVPRVDGYILPRVPGGYRAGDMGDVDGDFGSEGSGRRPATTIVPLIVDGKEIARVTLDGFETIGARK